MWAQVVTANKAARRPEGQEGKVVPAAPLAEGAEVSVHRRSRLPLNKLA